MDFTVFNLSDGSYVKSGICPEYDLHMQAEEGEIAVPNVRLQKGDGRLNLKTKKIEPIEVRKSDAEIVAEIVRERERRFAIGVDYDFKDDRGVHRIGTTKDDLDGWSEVNTAAFKAVARGKGYTIIQITTDTGPVSVTADEWLDVLDAIEEFRQPIWQKSFQLQSMNPLPQDADNPEHWN